MCSTSTDMESILCVTPGSPEGHRVDHQRFSILCVLRRWLRCKDRSPILPLEASVREKQDSITKITRFLFSTLLTHFFPPSFSGFHCK
ncbi:unnamed protein product [Lactuca virosa]|uniref:Uncharacterized protein n=1 Tax=Lactuca virosa TaxID=75947 RepID=A0AAU9LYS7_9ASTR|nr:unnamed protein product [Lactuca virosa]